MTISFWSFRGNLEGIRNVCIICLKNMEATRPKNGPRDMVKLHLPLIKREVEVERSRSLAYILCNRKLSRCVHACLFGLLLIFVCFQTRGVDSVFLFSKLVYDTNQKERFEINSVRRSRSADKQLSGLSLQGACLRSNAGTVSSGVLICQPNQSPASPNIRTNTNV